jgi:NADH-quinone oxidoreductase subunit N
MNWMLFIPECYYIVMAGVFFGLCLMDRFEARRNFRLSITLSALGVGICLASVGQRGDLFANAYHVDLFSQVFKILLALGLLFTIALCSNLHQESIGVSRSHQTEFFLLLTTCTIAMMLLVSSVHLLAIYISLETSSYCLYILVYLREGRSETVRTCLRYFLIGASASAVMLFGMALVYGFSQAAHVVDLARLPAGVLSQPAVLLGLSMMLCGFLFKLAVFPFHFWAPDVYETASNPVTAFIATASKVAAIALLIRLSALAGAGRYLSDILTILAIVTMTVGNLSAIVQNDLKRLLAWSSVAQAGYVLIGILSMSLAGYTAAVFYSAGILVMKLTCFLVVVKVADDGRNLSVGDLAGLHQRCPMLALALMLALFGLAGVPPTIGFSGKLLIFTAAMENGHFLLVLIAMINVVISLYYYLLVLKAAYLQEPAIPQAPLTLSVGDRLLAVFLIGVIITVGFFPNPLIRLAHAAASGLI